jgi:protein phosphatase
MDLTVAARTDVGMIRSGNEDSFFAHATRERGIFIVADGMGAMRRRGRERNDGTDHFA